MGMFGNGFRPGMMLSEADLPPGSPVGPMGVMPGDQDRPAGVMIPGDKPRGGLFGKLRKGWNGGGWADLGSMGAAILAANGNPIGEGVMAFQQMQRQRAEDEAQNEYRRAMTAKAMEPDAKWEPVLGPDGQQTGQRNTVTGEMKALPGRETDPAGVREWEYMQSLPEDQQARFQQFRQPVPYGYTPQGIEAQIKVAGGRAAAVAANRPPPAARAAPKPPAGFILDQ